jgi:hypothetical protein
MRSLQNHKNHEHTYESPILSVSNTVPYSTATTNLFFDAMSQVLHVQCTLRHKRRVDNVVYTVHTIQVYEREYGKNFERRKQKSALATQKACCEPRSCGIRSHLKEAEI